MTTQLRPGSPSALHITPFDPGACSGQRQSGTAFRFVIVLTSRSCIRVTTFHATILSLVHREEPHPIKDLRSTDSTEVDNVTEAHPPESSIVFLFESFLEMSGNMWCRPEVEILYERDVDEISREGTSLVAAHKSTSVGSACNKTSSCLSDAPIVHRPFTFRRFRA